MPTGAKPNSPAESPSTPSKPNGCNLGHKNPHAPDAVCHDPDQLLADHRRMQAAVRGLRDPIKAVLAEFLPRSA